MKARDLMTADPTTCRPTDNLKDIVGVMRDEDCGIVPITEGNGEHRVVGVVTDRDIALALGERDEKPSAVRASAGKKATPVRAETLRAPSSAMMRAPKSSTRFASCSNRIISYSSGPYDASTSPGRT